MGQPLSRPVDGRRLMNVRVGVQLLAGLLGVEETTEQDGTVLPGFSDKELV